MSKTGREFLIVAVLCLTTTIADAKNSILENSEGTVGKVVGNYRLINQDGKELVFNSLRGKAVLLNFMYINCPDMCVITNYSIQKFMSSISNELTKKLVVLSVSIDPANDTPKSLNNYGLEFTDNFDNWYFTTTDTGTLSKMVADLGFTYKKVDDKMEHLSRLTLIAPNGVVKRHFYGTDYDPAELKKSVETVLAGKSLSDDISGVASRLLIYCSNYDPLTKTYKIDYAFLWMIVINYLLVMATIIYLFRNKIKSLFKRKD